VATASNAEHIVIVTGSSPLADTAVASIPDTAIVIAVDGGLDHALAAGLHPSGLIGDLDSVSADALAWAEQNATISRHPADKDDTDTELALRFVAGMTPAQLTMIGGGDRLDHTFAALGALGLPALTSIPVLDAWWGEQHVDVLHGPGQATLQLAPHSIVSLLALHGECTGVTITGVRWQLDDATLAPVVGWGVSNEVVADGTVTIRLSTGVLTVFDVPASTILPNPAPGPAANPSPGPAANPSPNQPSTTDGSQKDHIA
jgi:thiamine pyrophosphokinase